VRVDYEQATPLSEDLEHEIIMNLPRIMKDIDIIAVSDYGKGFLTTTLLAAIMNSAKELKISVIADPKGHDFAKYFGTTVIKPNLSEAYAAANLPLQSSLEQVAHRILSMTGADLLMVTRAEAGISLFEANGNRQDFPVQIKEVKDVTGAGDTVLAVLAYSLANRLSYSEAAQLCNVAAGIAIERIGCARVGLADLAQRLLERDVSHKVFDEDHLFALQEVLRSISFNLLVISNTQEISQDLFRAIRQISKKNSNLLIYLIDAHASKEFVEHLSSVREVSFIVVHQEKSHQLLISIEPQESFIFDKCILQPIQSFQQVFENQPI